MEHEIRPFELGCRARPGIVVEEEAGSSNGAVRRTCDGDEKMLSHVVGGFNAALHRPNVMKVVEQKRACQRGSVGQRRDYQDCE